MSFDTIDLTKKAEKVQIILDKIAPGVKLPPIRVATAVDVSGSMQGLFNNGTVQKVYDQLLGVALKFDDDGQLDSWIYHNNAYRMPTATGKDAGTYVRNVILRSSRLWGGTSYAPVLNDVVKAMFEPRKTGGMFSKPAIPTDPAMLLFITDGQSDDEVRADQALRDAQGKNIYFQMIGVGNPRLFGFLKRMGDLYPNVGFVSLDRLDMSDEQLYEQLISEELITWVKKF